jgi:hypothetical protein
VRFAPARRNIFLAFLGRLFHRCTKRDGYLEALAPFGFWVIGLVVGIELLFN